MPSDLYYITIDCVSVFCEVIDPIGDDYLIEDGLFLPNFHKKTTTSHGMNMVGL